MKEKSKFMLTQTEDLNHVYVESRSAAFTNPSRTKSSLLALQSYSSLSHISIVLHHSDFPVVFLVLVSGFWYLLVSFSLHREDTTGNSSGITAAMQ